MILMIYGIGLALHIIIYYLLIDPSVVSFHDFPFNQNFFVCLYKYNTHVTHFLIPKICFPGYLMIFLDFFRSCKHLHIMRFVNNATSDVYFILVKGLVKLYKKWFIKRDLSLSIKRNLKDRKIKK